MKKRFASANHRRVATRGDLVFCIALACMIPPAFALLVHYTDMPPLYSAMPLVLLYLILIACWAKFRRTSVTPNDKNILNSLTNSNFGSVLTSLVSPAFLLDKEGTVVWANDSLVDVCGQRALTIGTHVSDFCDQTAFDMDLKGQQNTESMAHDNSESTKEIRISIGKRQFVCETVCTDLDGESYRFVLLNECTEREYWKDRYQDEREVVAYIAIDNVDETLQSVQEQFQAKILDVENILYAWTEEMNGFLRCYERNRYVAVFAAHSLRHSCEHRFDILDRVRSVRVGDGLPITISMGVSDVAGTLAERNRAAQVALDMALLRGGDQVAYKSDDKVEFYGGKTKTGFKRTNIKARVVANQLAASILRADHVLIMGHRFGDFDSFGASIGLAHFAMRCGADVHIVSNLRDKNLALCYQRLADVDAYRGIFVDAAESLEMLGPNTLLVIVDVNNFNHVESPETAEKASQIIVIDHHRKTAEFGENVLLEYIEPSASSASELVGEMLQQHFPTGTLGETQAELLLSGILLDTKQFTRNTGSRTFLVASFLRAEGASLSNAENLFKSELDDLLKESRFNTNVVLYKDRIALSTYEGETDESYRIVAAKSADKLLNLRGVDAAFALVLINGVIHISARSNGTVNVQLILERLHGGGHYDVAGAQISGMTMQEALALLRSSIDTQLEAH